METILLPAVILGITGIFMGVFLAFASKKFEVQRDPKIEAILAILPGVNCGGCGYPGCAGYAIGVVEDGAKTTLCAPGGPKVVSAISEILGVAAPEPEKKRMIYRVVLDEAFYKKNQRMIDTFKAALEAKEEEKIGKLEGAAERTKNDGLLQVYKNLKAGKELKVETLEEVAAEFMKMNARMIDTFKAAFEAKEEEKMAKLEGAAEKTQKGDLLKIYQQIRNGQEVQFIPGAPKEVKVEAKEEVKA